MPDTYTSQFSGEEIDAALRAAQIISGADTPAALREKLEIRGDTIPVSATDPTPISEALTASGGGVNPNLLDNWFFGRPVNQRGQTEYTAGGYTVDRWKFTTDGGNVAISNGYLDIYSTRQYGSYLEQKIDPELAKALAGKTVTYSVLAADGDTAFSANMNKNGSYVDSFTIEPHTVSYKTWTFPTDSTDVLFNFAGNAAGHVRPIAAKLELGSTQTLAHKENGVWVLNEIPDYGEQLRRCQLYRWRFCPAEYVGSAIAFGISANAARALIYLPEQMRTNPTLNFNKNTGLFLTGVDGDIFGMTLALVWTSPNSICVEFQKSGAFAPNSVYFVRGDGSSAIDISADL